ncbi:nitroreductase [Parvibaculum sp.]|uniref:nitroreductase family protein n=1 Tax=Parvibaculum sp. TaxID=2024848 RepID=UPI000C3DD584|nr:nitroreductase [Parvibaculum sp.]MAM93993.1 nitroreductase [Parvibaculum sp.]HCX68594.1 nitroreductase [Rhodobiaceae bacterium]
MAKSQETIDLLLTRRSAKALTMVEPGPSDSDIETILRAGARVPDHGKLAPWRFILFKDDARKQFGDVLARVYAVAEPRATDEQVAFERGRLARAPLVIAVVSRVTPGIKIPEWEQLLSAGAVCQNMLVAGTALGFGAQWLTEWYAFDDAVNQALGLGENEKIAGYLYFGSESVAKDERPRPDLSDITSEWKPGS